MSEIDCIEQQPHRCKNLSYNGKHYQIDFDLMIQNSIYFNEHQNEFSSLGNIELNETMDITDDIIQTFVDYCLNKPIKITENNIFYLNYFSKKYEMKNLYEETSSYIDENFKTLIFKSLQFKNQGDNLSNDQIDTSTEEKFLSEHLYDHIEDEIMLKLPISVLDRILKSYICHYKKDKEKEMPKIKEFLFKCLDKYQRDASILFSNLNCDDIDREMIIKLCENYKDIFDFNMLNSKSLFITTYELIKELRYNKNEIQEIRKEYLSNLEKMKNEQLSFQKNFESKFCSYIDKYTMIEKEYQSTRKNTEDLLQSTRRNINNIEETQNRHYRIISQNKDSINNIESKISQFATRSQVRNAFSKGWSEVPHSCFKKAGISYIENDGAFKGKNWGEIEMDNCWSAARDSIPS